MGETAPPRPAASRQIVAEPAGTHWYHSHVGVQYGNGLFGPFVVEEASPIAMYGRDEALFINDWFRESGDELFAALLSTARHLLLEGAGMVSIDDWRPSILEMNQNSSTIKLQESREEPQSPRRNRAWHDHADS